MVRYESAFFRADEFKMRMFNDEMLVIRNSLYRYCTTRAPGRTPNPNWYTMSGGPIEGQRAREGDSRLP